jgi:hypothetical protein
MTTNFTTWDVIQGASYVLDHDINPDDSYRIEQFLQQHRPGASKRFIAAVQREAVELRDRKRLHGLFEYINSKVPAWPDDKKVRDDLVAEIVDGVALKLPADWYRRAQPSDVIAVARCVAVLLIQQAAWRKRDDELNASYDKAAAEGVF